MPNPFFQSVTPLLLIFWGWVVLLLYWTISSLFTQRSKSTEPFLLRFQHIIPIGLAYYLILNRERHFFLFGEFYHTSWDNWIVYLALLMTVAGFTITVWARIHLGRYWSGIITLKEGHKVITTGPYRFVRHPIYSGWLLAILGSAFAAGTIDGFVGVELLTLAFLIKLQREEKMLTAELGDQYRQYMEQVPSAIIPWLGAHCSTGSRSIESDAFNRAALRSDQYRVFGILCICGMFAALDLINILASSTDRAFFGHSLAGWTTLAAYEGIVLVVIAQAQWQDRYVRPWVWAANTTLECLLPSLALLGLTTDTTYLGPYRALVYPGVLIYCLLIILSTLRLSPALCILAGATSAAGYAGVFLYTLHVAPRNAYRHFMPDKIYAFYPLLLLIAGIVAAAVARQIRAHLIAALQEVETRRKLDRVEYDLTIARSIQMGLLPKHSPVINGYDIAGWSQPADQTGGDYYDWIELPDGRLIVIIADASGHGIGPALLIAACRAYFRAIVQRDDPLESITAQVDALLTCDVPDGRFITAAIALLEPRSNKLCLYSAGHAPMYMYVAANNGVTLFDADQPPLGIHLGQFDSKARQLQLAPGDALVLVTDGFFECRNQSGQMLGPDRLGNEIKTHHALNATDMIRRLYSDVLTFSQGTAQADDITAVVIQRKPVI
jgi:serine phosphatase RsbU (regulator of sigma subunit)/protein-S-isoprenylcysteine O-methyltransferase Ste14